RPVPQQAAGGRSRGNEGRGLESPCPAGEGEGNRGSGPQELAGAALSGGHSGGRPEKAIHQDHRHVETGAGRGGQAKAVCSTSGGGEGGEGGRSGIRLRGDLAGGADLWPRYAGGQVRSGSWRG